MATSILAAALGLHGTKPEIPDFKPIDVNAEQAAAIEGNLASFGAASELAGKVNTFNTEQLEAMLRKAIPGYDDIQKQISENIKFGLTGKLTPGTESYLQRKAAASSLAGGFSGSGMHRNLELRDLGLQSYTETQRAMDSASKWIASTRATSVPRMFDAASMFVTPMQRISVDTNERNAAFNVQWMRNKLEAMPSPTEAAIGGFLDWIATTGESVASTYMGNIAGGLGKSGGDSGGSSVPNYSSVGGVGQESGLDTRGGSNPYYIGGV